MLVFSTRAIGGGWPSWSTGTPRRKASIWPAPGMKIARASTGVEPRAAACAGASRSRLPTSKPMANTSAASRTSAIVTNRVLLRMGILLGRHDLDRTLLVVGLLGDRVGRVERDLVDQLAGIEPGHEDHPLRHPVASARLHPRAHLAAPRHHQHLVAALEPPRARVVRVHEHA